MSFYRLGESFRWFVARVIDIDDPEKLGRLKIRIIHDQTGELGKIKSPFGIKDDELLWAYPLSAMQSASLHWKKVKELEEYDVPDWIDAVGLSPTGSSVGTYVFGFYLDGHEQNIPIVFGSYHKKSRWPEPPTDPSTGELLQIRGPDGESFLYNDVAALAKGDYVDPADGRLVKGQSLPKEPYVKGNLVSEPESAYKAKYPYNITYTTKSGHAIELDDTIGYERLHMWHKSGAYEEISNNPGENGKRPYKGRRVQRTKDDSFQIVDRNKESNIGNNHLEQIGNNEIIQIANNQLVTIGNNQVVIIANNQTVSVGANCTITVGNNCIVTVEGHVRIEAKKNITLIGDVTVLGSMDVSKSLVSGTGVDGAFSTPSGRSVTVAGGLITNIS
jgi:hypothetical protein